VPAHRAPHLRARVARRRRRLLVVALVIGALPLLPGASSAGEVPPWPGLPYLGYDPSRPGAGTPEDPVAPWAWAGLSQVGMAGSVRSKQWARIPLTILATNSLFESPDIPGSGSRITTSSLAYFVSPEGSAHNYGESPLIPVRTVAFGSVPVEVTLQLAQRRDAKNLPIGLEIVTVDGVRDGGGGYTDPAHLDERVDLRVHSLTVDGVDLGLGSTCVTRTPARLRLTSAAWEAPDESTYDPDHGFLAIKGGTLFGTLDVPPFSGCRTAAGDDVSPILSATVAGPGNPVTVRTGSFTCWRMNWETYSTVPPAPGETTAERANCLQVGDHPFADNPNIKAVPDPLPFPAHAP
jgi:hypothetical protein